jgi:capsular exopolysaccharide synthesis family protein
MSNIFDALQRAELENSGSEGPTLALASELLQAAEQKLRDFAPSVEQPAHRDAFDSDPAAPLEDLERCPVLAVSLRDDSRLVSLGKEASLGAEKFRFLAVRLRQLRQSRPLKKVLITSSIPQEGKSMVAANLACALALRTRQKTLLIDGDLRRPSVAKLFGLGKIPGITEWLRGDRGPMKSIYHLEEAGLWVLPAGDSPRNPLELMQTGRLSSLMEQLTSWFDWVVIDSPPVLPLADTSIWMRLSDGILLVTRQGATEKKQLKRGLEAIDQKKLLGALLNSSESMTNNCYYNEYRQMPSGSEQRFSEVNQFRSDNPPSCSFPVSIA